MNFKVSSSLSYQIEGAVTFITSIQGMQTPGQEVREESFLTDLAVNYEELAVGYEHNRFSRMSFTHSGEFSIDYSAEVETTALRKKRGELSYCGIDALSAEVIPYLYPSRYCESDAMRGMALDLFGDEEPSYQLVERVEQWIYENIAYSIGSTNEQSSAFSVLEGRAGVCRDFAHLGIAFCRALMIPARYATFYAHDLTPQDFHACFEVYLGGAWCVFDATRLAPLNGLVRISSGRDAGDAAVASLFGDVMGIDMQVSCFCLENEFAPLTREELQSWDEGYILL